MSIDYATIAGLVLQLIGDVIAGATLYFTIYYGKNRNK